MKYNPYLDAYRGIAISLVLAAHFTPRAWRQLGEYLEFDLGRMGVIGFFVLSGYLITGILLDYRQRIEAGTDALGNVWLRFVVRRTLRIFPLYYGSVCFFAFVSGVASLKALLPWHLAYASNFGQAIWGISYGPANHFWSLCVEEQFYLLWPVIILVLPLRRVHVLLMFVVGCSLVASATWACLGMDGRFAGYVTMGGPSFALASGALLSWYARQGKQAGPWLMRCILVLGMVAFFTGALASSAWASRFWLGSWELMAVDTSWSLCCVFFLYHLSRTTSAYLRPRPLVWLGKISYGVYVFQGLLAVYFTQIFVRLGITESQQPVLAFAVEMAVILAVSAASYSLYERPFLRLKDRVSATPRSYRPAPLAQ